MGIMSIEELRKIAFKDSFSNNYYKKLRYAIDNLVESKVVNEIIENNHVFYPKYLWKEEKDIELYFFSDERIIKVLYDEDGIINLTNFPIKDIALIELNNMSHYHRKVTLSLSFKRSSVLEFSTDDTNDNWRDKFYTVIIDLYKKLS